MKKSRNKNFAQAIEILADAIKVAGTFVTEWDIKDPSSWNLPDEKELYERCKKIVKDE